MKNETNNLDYECDWRLGLNLNPGCKGTIGYLLFWSGCGGLSLAKDMEVWNPFSGSGQTVANGRTITCIGLLESFRFQGESDAPVRMVAYVSKETAANVRVKLAGPMTTTSVQVAWYILSFDDDKKHWFEAAFVKNNARAYANVATEDGVLQMAIDNKAVRPSDGLDLQLVRFEFQITPSVGSSSLLEFATGSTQRLVKRWTQE